MCETRTPVRLGVYLTAAIVLAVPIGAHAQGIVSDPLSVAGVASVDPPEPVPLAVWFMEGVLELPI